MEHAQSNNIIFFVEKWFLFDETFSIKFHEIVINHNRDFVCTRAISFVWHLHLGFQKSTLAFEHWHRHHIGLNLFVQIGANLVVVMVVVVIACIENWATNRISSLNENSSKIEILHENSRSRNRPSAAQSHPDRQQLTRIFDQIAVYFPQWQCFIGPKERF